MHTSTAAAPRLSSLALAGLLTLAMLLGINTLAGAEPDAAQMAQTSTTHV